MATATACRRRAIEHLVATDHARGRLGRAAFDVVVDGLDLGPIAIRSAADRAWVQAAIAGPIQHAVDDALQRLVDELIEQLAAGHPELVGRILAAAPDGGPDSARRRRSADRLQARADPYVVLGQFDSRHMHRAPSPAALGVAMWEDVVLIEGSVGLVGAAEQQS